jgi:hypothetical protein
MAKYNSAQVVITEQDVSALAAEAFGHPYLILGETISGRDDTPVMVSNKANFVAMFGGTDTDMPGTYAAMEYLSFGNQLLFKRVTSTKFIKIQSSVTATVKKTDANYGNLHTLTLSFAAGALTPYLEATTAQLPTVLFIKPSDGTSALKFYIKKFLGTLPTNLQAYEIYWDSYGEDFDTDTRLALAANDITCDVYVSHAEKAFNSEVMFPKTGIAPSVGALTYDTSERANYIANTPSGLDSVSYYITSYANTSAFGSLNPVVASIVEGGGAAVETNSYAYRFTYTNGTIESAVSAVLVFTAPSSTGTNDDSILIQFPPMIAGYTGYNLYRAGGVGGSVPATEAGCVAAGAYAKVNTTPIGLTSYTDLIGAASGAIPTCPVTIQLNGTAPTVTTAYTNNLHLVSIDSNGIITAEYKLEVFDTSKYTWYKGSSPEPGIGDILYKVISVTSSDDTYPNSGASIVGDGGTTSMAVTGNYYASGFIPLVTAPGPLVATTIQTVPLTALSGAESAGGTGPANGTYTYVVTYVRADGSESAASTASSGVVVAGGFDVNLTSIPTALANTGITARKVYRCKLTDLTHYYLLSNGLISDNTTTILTDSDLDAALGTVYAAPTAQLVTGTYNYKVTYVTTTGSETELGYVSNNITSSASSVYLTSIPTASNSIVTARNIYRSKTGPTGAWYHLATIADNATTVFTDNLADTSLGVEGTSLVNTVYSRIIFYNSTGSYVLPNATDHFKAYLTILGNSYYYYAPVSFDRYAALCKGRGIWANGYTLYTAYNQTTSEYEALVYDSTGRLAERWTELTLSALVLKVNEYSAYVTLTQLSDAATTTGYVMYDTNVSGVIGSAQYYRATLHSGYDGFAKDVLGQTVDEGDFMANIDTGIAGSKYSLDPDFADLVSSASQIESFDGGLDYEVMLIPGYSDHPALAGKMVNVCESRKFSCCLLDTPSGLTPNAAIQYRTINLVSIASSYCALYWNYGKVYDPQNDTYVWLPPSVFAVRALAVTDSSATPWAAAAGLRRGLVPEILELETYPALGDRENLQGVQINPIAKIGNTLAIWGNKTTQVFKSMLSNFNIRRLLISAEKAVYITSQSALFEPNDKTERTRLMLSIQPIFDTIRQQRGLLAFLVADATTDADTAENIARFRIELQPTPTMEVILYDVVIKNPAQSLSGSNTI